ncbi:hypothetical protein BJ875DRAFT_514396, partial [Amylocarpus encephaloides]
SEIPLRADDSLVRTPRPRPPRPLHDLRRGVRRRAAHEVRHVLGLQQLSVMVEILDHFCVRVEGVLEVVGVASAGGGGCAGPGTVGWGEWREGVKGGVEHLGLLLVFFLWAIFWSFHQPRRKMGYALADEGLVLRIEVHARRDRAAACWLLLVCTLRGERPVWKGGYEGGGDSGWEGRQVWDGEGEREAEGGHLSFL